jgi:Photosynthetic reaction centre cytochrome C subunit
MDAKIQIVKRLNVAERSGREFCSKFKQILTNMRRSALIILSLACMVWISLAFTRQEDPWKNLKLLPKDITKKQLDSVMDHFSVSLNVGCDYCHAENADKTDMDFASDENKHKLVAREMLEMTYNINDKYFNYTGEVRNINTQLMITCYTCHNGSAMPATHPPPPKGN